MPDSPARIDRATEAYTRLRALIVHGRLAPGARVVERELAERLGISRTPVRAALQRLQQEGYLLITEASRQSRAMIAPLTREDAWELLNLVGELEGFAGRGAAQLSEAGRAALVNRLRAENAELKRAAEADRQDPNRIFDADDTFHREFVEAGAGPRLLALWHSIKPQTERYLRVYISALVDEIQRSVEEHEGIIEGIGRGRPDAAQRAVQGNWRRAADSLSRVIDAAGERGSW